MKALTIGALTAGLLLFSTGCAHNSIMASNVVRVGNFFGDLGVKGDGNDVTVMRASRLRKISLWGDNNTITVEDGATIGHVEFFGLQNTVSISDNLIVRLSEIGRGNQLIRRQTVPETEVRPETYYVPPTAPASGGTAEQMTPVGEIPVEQPEPMRAEDILRRDDVAEMQPVDYTPEP